MGKQVYELWKGTRQLEMARDRSWEGALESIRRLARLLSTGLKFYHEEANEW